jgi:hypothetical protein
VRAAPLVLSLLLAVCGFASADLSQGSGPALGLGLVPQVSCAVVQTTPHAASDPARCDVWGVRGASVVVLRVRLAGEGHVLAYADEQTPTSLLEQIGPAECRASATSGGACVARAVNTYPPTGTFNLHLFVDGPGHAVAEASLETLDLGLP